MTIPESAPDRSPVLLPGGGQRLTVLGNPWTVKLTGENTAGALAIMEATFAPGTGAPPHLHRGHEECFYVLSGAFRFQAGQDTVEAGPGGFLHVPRWLGHGFQNIGEEPGSLIGIFTPAGFERAFIELGTLPPGRPDPDAIHAIMAKYDQETL